MQEEVIAIIKIIIKKPNVECITKKKREPVAETEQETAWKCPRWPRTVQSRTDPSMKLFKPAETCNLLKTRMLPMFKCFTEKASLPGMELLVKKKKGRNVFFPLSLLLGQFNHTHLFSEDFKSIQALWKVPVNGISTSDCYETPCWEKGFSVKPWVMFLQGKYRNALWN